MKYNLILLSLCILSFSCSIDEEEPVTATEQAFGIRNDKSLSEYEAIAAEKNDERPDFSAVISFSYSLDGSDNEDFTATGTLIRERWILTAAHNFYDADSQSSPAPEEGIKVRVGNDPNNPTSTHTVAKLFIHPTWLNGDQEYTDANDLCLVQLSTAITNVTPAKLHTTSNEKPGEQIWFCGFGDYSQTQGQNPDLDSRKHAIENILDRTKNGLVTQFGNTIYSGGLMAFDFDAPNGNINALGDDNLSPDEIILGSGSSDSQALTFEGTTVEGDSGGPLFVKNGTDWEVAGVLSGGASEPIPGHKDGSYGDISIFIRVSSSYRWIASVIE